MKSIITILFYLAVTLAFSQSVENINYNNVSTRANDGGIFFADPTNATPQYEIPKGSGKNSIYSGAFWFAAKDINNQLKMSLQSYTPNTELFPGPICLVGGDYYDSTAYINQYLSSIWKVNKADIDYHIVNYNQPGYVLPTSISDWPGNGDQSVNVSENLAPFVDVNNDNIYDPMQGDYPNIRGDEAVYIIMNDRANPHAYGSDPLSIEVHVMLYQYASNDFLDNTTFVNLKVYNRGTQTLYDFYSTFFIDFDLGYYDDDYTGCDSSRNLMFAYNGDNFDEDGMGVTGYGTNPPAAGVVCLNHNASSIKQTYQLATLAEYYNVMRGLSPSGTPEPLYQFHGNPNDPSDLGTEYALGFTAGERKMILSVDHDVLQPLTGEFCVDYAVAYNDETGDYLANAEGLFAVVDSIQAFYDAQNYSCEEVVASLNENQAANEISIYPNPSNGLFDVNFGIVLEESVIEVFNLSGKLIERRALQGTDETRIEISDDPGVYVVRVNTEQFIWNKKVIVQ